MHPPGFQLSDGVAAAVVALVFVLLVSLLREPVRQRYMAIFVAGAGAAYLNGGLGLWEFGFCAVMSYCAYHGLQSYHFIGIGWLLHTGWDVVHHFYGNPIMPFVPTSSGQRAVADVLLAVWFFYQAPSVYDFLRRRREAAKSIAA